MSDYLEYIPTILSHFIPGYLGFSILRSITGIKIESSFTISISCAVSFISIYLIRVLQSKHLYLTPATPLELILSIVICCLFFSILTKFLRWNKTKELLSDTFHITHPNTIWESLSDLDNVNIVVVKLKSYEYRIRGQLTSINENSNGECWLGLVLYEYLDDEGNCLAKCDNADESFIFNASEVEFATLVTVEKP